MYFFFSFLVEIFLYKLLFLLMISSPSSKLTLYQFLYDVFINK